MASTTATLRVILMGPSTINFRTHRRVYGKSLWERMRSRGKMFPQKPAMQIVAVHALERPEQADGPLRGNLEGAATLAEAAGFEPARGDYPQPA